MRPFVDGDMSEMNRWRAAWGMPALTRSQLPKFGVIEPGVIVAFLYVTDSDVGFLDELVSNPEASHEQRSQVFHGITEMLVCEARSRGITRLMALTTNYPSARLAVEIGFAMIPGYLVGKRSV